jgi:hypothetical protein
MSTLQGGGSLEMLMTADGGEGVLGISYVDSKKIWIL